ncbi:hypothetical protein [Alienimonas chondri]|uniref:Uncharacterized protein n=1 Tax=Alienimonas chondri TaxID=2681879 RepID=A0ABX1VGJ7_9PLAN|nr:hypothetical protein [Alienimonas chondri]NNJ26962.1 hypothetical protein [Alienimonas chondri]
MPTSKQKSEGTMIDHETAANNARDATDYIQTCCGTVGSFHGSPDVYQFLKDAAGEMAAATPSTVLPSRYIEHVAYALNMTASNRFLSPPAAIASVYLATRFEFYFRVLSGKLNADGSWISSASQQAAQSAINDHRLSWRRVSSVALAYKIMMLNRTLPVVRYFEMLDRSLYMTPTTVVGPMTVSNLGDRIEFGRHAVSHGHWGDMSAEAVFYGLMTSIVFYSAEQ